MFVQFVTIDLEGQDMSTSEEQMLETSADNKEDDHQTTKKYQIIMKVRKLFFRKIP
jgi:hypothetical protein